MTGTHTCARIVFRRFGSHCSEVVREFHSRNTQKRVLRTTKKKRRHCVSFLLLWRTCEYSGADGGYGIVPAKCASVSLAFDLQYCCCVTPPVLPRRALRLSRGPLRWA